MLEDLEFPDFPDFPIWNTAMVNVTYGCHAKEFFIFLYP